jgi:hypothetical protein
MKLRRFESWILSPSWGNNGEEGIKPVSPAGWDSLKSGDLRFGFHKMQDIYWSDEQLTAYQEWLCCMRLVNTEHRLMDYSSKKIDKNLIHHRLFPSKRVDLSAGVTQTAGCSNSPTHETRARQKYVYEISHVLYCRLCLSYLVIGKNSGHFLILRFPKITSRKQDLITFEESASSPND